MASLRKSLQRFAEDLQLFSGQLSQETQELKRNVDNRPITGATNFRHCLEDINERLGAVGDELQALEAVSLDAISLEELMGHCTALYQQNHTAIAQLEMRLQQYGYRDLYAPLPPENPLDMLMLRSTGAGPQQPLQSARGARVASPSGGTHSPDGLQLREPLDHITNSLAATNLHGHDSTPGSAARPRTVVKAMAPMTAAKPHIRTETPSSLSSSPFEALSPSMRELLGKYGAVPSTAGPPTGSFSGTPYSTTVTPPGLGQLSPAFAAARAASEQAMAAADMTSRTAAAMEDPAYTPEQAGAAPGWQADPSMYTALTATAKKLANKPDFLEQYRQRFPHIVASTERLLASVEKQQAPQGLFAAAAAAGGGGGAGAMAALAAATNAVQQQQQQAGAARPQLGSRQSGDEDSTAQLYSQLISSRSLAQEDSSAGEELQAEPSAATPIRGGATAASPSLASTPSTEALLSRAFSATGHGGPEAAAADSSAAHPISTLTSSGSGSSTVSGTASQTGAATADGAAAGHAQRNDRSRPDLQEAVDAALRRNHSQQQQPAAPPTAAAAPTRTVAAAAGPAAPQDVPPLRLVPEEEYDTLPTFIKGQLSLEQVNSTLATVHNIVTERAGSRGMAGFTLEDLEGLGMGGKAKVFINSIVKLSRAHLKVVYGQGTLYLLM